MKTFIAATLVAIGYAAHGNGYNHIHYDNSADLKHDWLPNKEFNIEVRNFDEWNPTLTQDTYEGRLETEASLMVALEALREALGDIDREIEYLEGCIDSNESEID